MKRRYNLSRYTISAFAVLFVSQLWCGAIEPAREAARRIQCKNHLYQHSGYHPGARVVLDADGKVAGIRCCMSCGFTDAQVYFEDVNGVAIDKQSVSLEALVEASGRLHFLKLKPWYRSSFSSLFRQND